MRRLIACLTVAALTVLAPVPARADSLSQSFTSGGLTSRYHLFDAGIDRSKPVGLLMYTDGSGGYGIDNPNSTHLLDADGTNGLVAVARKHNLVLVVPEAPAPGCDGSSNCWYDSTAPAKAQWSADLMAHIKTRYPINNGRIVIGGYSSGAQWATRWFLPTHGEAQSVDLAVAIAYGGEPAVTPKFSDAYKAATVVSFDTGTADSAYTTASYGARGGEAWYRTNGFTTDTTWPTGIGHNRSGQFDTIMDREISQHLGAITATAQPKPTATPTRTNTPTKTRQQRERRGGLAKTGHPHQKEHCHA